MTREDQLLNRSEIITMAGKAFETPGTEPAFRNGFFTVTPEELECFAALIASRVASASASVEREACAVAVWRVAGIGLDDQRKAIAAIRARGNDDN